MNFWHCNLRLTCSCSNWSHYSDILPTKLRDKLAQMQKRFSLRMLVSHCIHFLPRKAVVRFGEIQYHLQLNRNTCKWTFPACRCCQILPNYDSPIHATAPGVATIVAKLLVWDKLHQQYAGIFPLEASCLGANSLLHLTKLGGEVNGCWSLLRN